MPRMRIGIGLLALAAVLGVARGWAQPPADLTATIDAIAAAALEQPIAGLSIAVGRRGKPIITRAYGRANIERGVPVTPDTIFHIASISKNIEAAIALKLAEQGKLSLDEDVRTYVPQAPTHGERVTPRQLLSHTSGLYNFTSLPEAQANEGRDWTHDQVFGLIQARPFDFAPGTGWHYSNSGFYLAGVAIERAAGASYADYVRQAIFAPLGMQTASLCTVHDRVSNLASGYDAPKATLEPAP